MNTTLVGYFPRKRTTRTGWVSPYREYPDAEFPAPEPVAEICSVSRCIAGGPDSREAGGEEWNFFGGYSSPAAAWAAIEPAERKGFQVLAYRVFPMLFTDGSESPLEVEPQLVFPHPPEFERLGYDVVELTVAGWSFGCSPLSCNGLAAAGGISSVNQFCLIETKAEAFEVARRFSETKPEPGPYCVVEVSRG